MRRTVRRAAAAWVVAAGALAVCGARAGEAAPDLKRMAITDPAQADADYGLQGEYVGQAWRPGCGCWAVGLQVVALGDGQFAGAWHWGGLPGAGWDGRAKRTLAGTRRGSHAELSDEQYVVRVDGSSGAIEDLAGRPVGRLTKVERLSPTLGAPPPANAVVLFAEGQAHSLEGARVTEDGLLMPGFTTAMPVRDFRLHLEFRTPYMPYARGQGRGNSGVYIQQRYEVQILDSFGLTGEANECGGLYKQRRPDVNMCLPPLTWQTYDIEFRAARWTPDGRKLCNARITVYHNGVPVHCDQEVTGKTGAGRPEGPEPRPIHFQYHGNPVRFRNVWIVLYPERPACQPPARRGMLRRILARRPLRRALCRLRGR